MEEETMRWGYYIGSGRNKPLSLELKISSYCHALITGASNSGKSYALLYLLGCLLQDDERIVVYFCDFKNSKDFEFLEGYPHYYKGNACYEGVMDYYESFTNAREQREEERRHILIFDEYPSCINYFSTKDKQEKTKKATDIMNVIAEVLMLGRGISYGVWIVTQRADASLFSNGARDNFMIIVGLGRMSKEQKGMIFSGEEIPQKIYRQGEGCILADGYPLMEIYYPKIKNMIDWKKHIKEILR